MSTWVDVAPAGEVPPGDRRVVNVDDTLIAVFNIDGEYFAIQDLCTHDGAPLAGGILDRDQIICPRHGARFCVKTGAALTPPAYEPVSRYPVRVHAGVIQVYSDPVA